MSERDPAGITYHRLPRVVGIPETAYLVKDASGVTLGRVIRSGTGRSTRWRAYAADGTRVGRTGGGFIYRADAAAALLRHAQQTFPPIPPGAGGMATDAYMDWHGR